ncbi:hypothetical protein HDU93_008065 [Gonapodya sp. JEL0774]|nr:hypothetical protein HDU93_008065 [Gonapodya sp. JEL0774]
MHRDSLCLKTLLPVDRFVADPYNVLNTVLAKDIESLCSISYISYAHTVIAAANSTTDTRMSQSQVSQGSSSSSGAVSLRIIPFNDLIIGEELGEGGFGVVRAGEWMFSKVAIKTLLNVGVRSRRPEMFEREALKWSQLMHPHVLPLLGIAERGEDRLMISPLMENGSVRDYLEVRSDANRMELIYNVAAACAYLHSRDCIHADLKPDKSGDALVGDFGAAKFRVQGKETTRGPRPGTERYMPPERVTNRRAEVTKEMDVYSFGVTAFEIWSERCPFDDLQEGFALTTKIVEGKRDFLLNYEYMPDDLWELLVQCTEKEPSRRPQMREVAETMKELLKTGHTGPHMFEAAASSRRSREPTPPNSYIPSMSLSREYVPAERLAPPLPSIKFSTGSADPLVVPFHQTDRVAAAPAEQTGSFRTVSSRSGSGPHFAELWTQEDAFSAIRDPRMSGGISDDDDEAWPTHNVCVPVAVQVVEPDIPVHANEATTRARRPPRKSPAPRRAVGFSNGEDSESAPQLSDEEPEDDDDEEYTPDAEARAKRAPATIKGRLRSAGKPKEEPTTETPAKTPKTPRTPKTPKTPRTKSPPLKASPAVSANGRARGRKKDVDC